MYYPDTMIEIALDRQAELVCKVQAVGARQSIEPAASAGQWDDVVRTPWPAGATGFGRVLAVLATALRLFSA